MSPIINRTTKRPKTLGSFKCPQGFMSNIICGDAKYLITTKMIFRIVVKKTFNKKEPIKVPIKSPKPILQKISHLTVPFKL